MATAIGTLSVELTANAAGFVTNLNRAGRGVGSFSKTVEANANRLSAWAGRLTAATGALVALAAGASFLSLIKGSFEAIDATAKLSDELDIATEKLIGLRHAASLSGSSSDELDNSLRQLTRRLGEARRGSGEAVHGLESLGLTLSDLDEMDVGDKFTLIADRIAAIEDPTQQATTAYSLFGRQGQKLLPLLQEGAAGLAEMGQEAEDLGITFSRFDAAEVEEAGDSIDRMRAIFRGVAQRAAIELSPAITSLTAQTVEWFKTLDHSKIDRMARAVGGYAMSLARGVQHVIQWVDEHRGMLQVLTSVYGPVLKMVIVAKSLSIVLAPLAKIAASAKTAIIGLAVVAQASAGMTSMKREAALADFALSKYGAAAARAQVAVSVANKATVSGAAAVTAARQAETIATAANTAATAANTVAKQVNVGAAMANAAASMKAATATTAATATDVVQVRQLHRKGAAMAAAALVTRGSTLSVMQYRIQCRVATLSNAALTRSTAVLGGAMRLAGGFAKTLGGMVKAMTGLSLAAIGVIAAIGAQVVLLGKTIHKVNVEGQSWSEALINSSYEMGRSFDGFIDGTLGSMLRYLGLIENKMSAVAAMSNVVSRIRNAMWGTNEATNLTAADLDTDELQRLLGQLNSQREGLVADTGLTENVKELFDESGNVLRDSNGNRQVEFTYVLNTEAAEADLDKLNDLMASLEEEKAAAEQLAKDGNADGVANAAAVLKSTETRIKALEGVIKTVESAKLEKEFGGLTVEDTAAMSEAAERLNKVGKAVSDLQRQASGLDLSDTERQLAELAGTLMQVGPNGIPIMTAEGVKLLEQAREQLEKIERQANDAKFDEMFGGLQEEVDSLLADVFDLDIDPIEIELKPMIDAGATDDQIEAYRKLLEDRQGLQEAKDFKDEAEAIRDSLKTPIDRAGEQLEQLQKLRDLNLLEPDEFLAAAEKIKADLGTETETDLSPNRGAELMEFNASNVVRMMDSMMNGGDRTVDEKQLKEEQKTNQLLARIENVLKGQPQTQTVGI